MSEIEPFEVRRPWGKFRQFTHNDESTVKIITVKAGEAFSLQYHDRRTEFWRILSGSPDVIIGESVIRARTGDEFEILPRTKHRIAAGERDAEILEIALGKFDEDDIVRLDDKYGRTS